MQRHDGPLKKINELQCLEKANKKNIKTFLKQEICFQKFLHLIDVKERDHQYKMNFLTTEQLIQNFIILLDDCENREVCQAIPFPF